MREYGRALSANSTVFQSTLYAAALSALLAACATAPKSESANSAAEAAPSRSQSVSSPRVSLKQEQGPLGEVIRQIGEESGGGIVAVYGLAARNAGPLNFSRAPLERVAPRLARNTGCALQQTSEYYLLYYPDRAYVCDVSLRGKLDPALASMRVGLRFADGTPLFIVFSWITQAARVTVVADQTLANYDVRCGEIALPELPLETALEALLKSAGAVNFEVDSAPGYVFLRHASNPPRETAMLNTNPLTPNEQAALDRVLTLHTPLAPATPGRLEIQEAVKPLSVALPDIARQAGIPIVAERSLNDFPVVPSVFYELPLGTILDLLIRQWPVPEFGYQVTHDRIVLRRSNPAG